MYIQTYINSRRAFRVSQQMTLIVRHLWVIKNGIRAIVQAIHIYSAYTILRFRKPNIGTAPAPAKRSKTTSLCTFCLVGAHKCNSCPLMREAGEKIVDEDAWAKRQEQRVQYGIDFAQIPGAQCLIPLWEDGSGTHTAAHITVHEYVLQKRPSSFNKYTALFLRRLQAISIHNITGLHLTARERSSSY